MKMIKIHGRIFSGGVYNGDICIIMIVNCVKFKMNVKGICKHKSPCKLYSFVNEKGEEIVKVKGSM